jgi:UDP:flavonoid glycosyltransferase YjiC (YdhE family)
MGRADVSTAGRRVLIATWDGGGNTPPALNLGARLARRGQHVRILGWESMASRAADAGLEFVAYPSLEPWPEGLAFEDDFPRLLEAAWGEPTGDDIRDAASAFGADVIVIDCNLSSGFKATRELHVPRVALVHLSYHTFMYVSGERVTGMNVAEMLDGVEVVLALQPPGFDPPSELPPGAVYVGPVLAPGLPPLETEIAELLAAPGDPWVLLSLSTTLQPGLKDALAEILSTLGQLPIRVFLTLSAGAALTELDVPANTTVRGRVPHELVMPLITVVVCHAGMTTISTALTFGKPLVCVPQGRDQIGNANRVAAIGAGLVTTERTVSVGVRMLLSEERYRHAAERIAEASTPLGGGELAAELVSHVASRSPPRS